jgi:hypothetical protein
MRRDFTLDALSEAIRAGYGLGEAVLTPLKGYAHSLNFKVESGGEVFAAKAFPAKKTLELDRLLAHTAPSCCALAATRLFDGKTLDFGAWKVMAMRWIEGERRSPDELDAKGVESLLSSYAAFLRGLRDDGFILPVRDSASLKRPLAERLKSMGLASWLRELKLVSDDSLALDPERVRIIHGDLHYENFRFFGDDVKGFLDIEELRFGTPAEDLVRYVLCSAERRKWLTPRARRRILAVFATFVERMPLTRGEWLFAIDSYLVRKLDKRVRRGRPSLLCRLRMAARFGLYRDLREVVYAGTPAERTRPTTVVKVFGGTVRRFTGGDSFLWKDRYLFTCNPACQDYDWLCVYDEIPPGWPELGRGGMPVRCPRERTALITQEPVSVKSYCRPYVMQFGHLLSNRPKSAENHPGHFPGAGYMVWYTGRSFADEQAREPGAERKDAVSAVCSAKNMRHTHHAARFRLMEALERDVAGFERFGKGVRPLKRKCDALDDFKYHVAMENHVAPGHWTEKLADPIVCGCLTFYAGDPGAAKILPERSFIPIPADDPALAVEIVKKAVADGEWEKRRDAIAEARALLLEKYNLFAQIASLIEAAGPAAATAKTPTPPLRLLTRRQARRRHPLAAISDLLVHVSRIFTWRARP